MHIVHIASELAPIAKAGGLGDVIFGLARETIKQGHTVDILIPKYDCIDYSKLHDLKPIFRELWSFDGPYQYHNTIWSAEVQGLRVLLLEPHHPNYFFSRGSIYGQPDDIDRFIYFSRAALEYLYKSGTKPDIIHVHDWPTALAAVLYKEMYIPLGFRTKGVVLTIHNLQHQGKCTPSNVTRSGLRGEDFLTPEKMQDPVLPKDLNLLKGGIVYADAITTVSPTYEKEIKTKEFGCNLDTTLIQYQNKLHGILNGIDYDYWNPKTDPFIPKDKKECRAILRKKLGLKESKGPLICSVTRLAAQKGPALIKHALKKTVQEGGQYVVLGIPAEIETSFSTLQKEMASNKNVAIHLGLDETLAHLTYAAADMIVLPSIFEPCGLSQMIALRYGCVPIVRKTGGLADTVIDEKNGFVFELPTTSDLDKTLDRALSCFKKEPARFAAIIKQGMESDFSWSRSTEKYLEVYKQLAI